MDLRRGQEKGKEEGRARRQIWRGLVALGLGLIRLRYQDEIDTETEDGEGAPADGENGSNSTPPSTTSSAPFCPTGGQ